ncbi:MULTISPECIES: hypothetical protein [Haloplanus]|uniref:hypothetical protein n=1 Tax=Haloplanus TaxID=376170 RepID=UPI0012FE21F4|nr:MULTISPECIES: hypothetical protein [Haloplanus]
MTLDPDELLAISGLVLVGGAAIGFFLAKGGYPRAGQFISLSLAAVSGLFQILIALRSG